MIRMSRRNWDDAPVQPSLSVPAGGVAPTATVSDGTDPLAHLSRREREVAALLGRRWTDAEIAMQLGISVRTASDHVGRILAKLGVANRREAGALAVQHGMIYAVPVSPPAKLRHFLRQSD